MGTTSIRRIQQINAEDLSELNPGQIGISTSADNVTGKSSWGGKDLDEVVSIFLEKDQHIRVLNVSATNIHSNAITSVGNVNSINGDYLVNGIPHSHQISAIDGISSNTPTNGQVLQYVSSAGEYVPSTLVLSGGGGGGGFTPGGAYRLPVANSTASALTDSDSLTYKNSAISMVNGSNTITFGPSTTMGSLGLSGSSGNVTDISFTPYSGTSNPHTASLSLNDKAGTGSAIINTAKYQMVRTDTTVGNYTSQHEWYASSGTGSIAKIAYMDVNNLNMLSGGINIVGSYNVNGAPHNHDGRYALSAHNQAWSTVSATPTTLAGYGITDAIKASTSGAFSLSGHTHSLSAIVAPANQILFGNINGTETTSTSAFRYIPIGLSANSNEEMRINDNDGLYYSSVSCRGITFSKNGASKVSVDTPSAPGYSRGAVTFSNSDGKYVRILGADEDSIVNNFSITMPSSILDGVMYTTSAHILHYGDVSYVNSVKNSSSTKKFLSQMSGNSPIWDDLALPLSAVGGSSAGYIPYALDGDSHTSTSAFTFTKEYGSAQLTITSDDGLQSYLNLKGDAGQIQLFNKASASLYGSGSIITHPYNASDIGPASMSNSMSISTGIGVKNGISINAVEGSIRLCTGSAVGGTERVILTSAGYIGIGTNVPAYGLELSGVDNIGATIQANCQTSNDYSSVRAISDSGNIRMLAFGSTIATSNSFGIASSATNQIRITGGDGVLGTTTAHSLILGTNGNKVVELTKDSNVGVGRSPTTYPLEVEGDIQSTTTVRAIDFIPSTTTSTTTSTPRTLDLNATSVIAYTTAVSTNTIIFFTNFEQGSQATIFFKQNASPKTITLSAASVTFNQTNFTSNGTTSYVLSGAATASTYYRIDVVWASSTLAYVTVT